MQTYIDKGSFLIFDEWKSSKAAVERLGYRHAPPVNHSMAWRDVETGFHSNDVESENARLKSWLRAHLHISVTDREDPDDASLFSHSFSRDMNEYCFDVSVGKSFRDAMRGLAVAAGGSFTKR